MVKCTFYFFSIASDDKNNYNTLNHTDNINIPLQSSHSNFIIFGSSYCLFFFKKKNNNRLE